MARQQADLDRYSASSQQAEKELNSLRQQVQTKETELAQAETNRQEVLREQQQIIDELTESRRSHEQLRLDYDELQVECHKTEEERQRVYTAYEKACAERDQFAAEVTSAQNQHVAEAKEQLTQAGQAAAQAKRLESLQAERDALLADRRKTADAHTQLQSELAEEREARAALLAEHDALRRMSQDLPSESQAQHIAELEAEMVAMKQQWDEKREEYHGLLMAAKKTVKESLDTFHQQSKQIKQLQAS